jgi:hypothetical protein
MVSKQKIMRGCVLAGSFLLAACATAEAQPRTCPPAGYDSSAMQALKQNEWQIADTVARQRFALALTGCLASNDPALRDGAAFEALQHMMRARQLTPDTMSALQDDLEARLRGPEGDGFERPFAALVLAEVARADRIEPYLTPERRSRLLNAAVDYMSGVRDYRGFDEREGWRHGVAHGADLMLQLALNPAFARPELMRIRDAVAVQVAPEGHSYVYGESDRLAAPILYIARRNDFTPEDWTAWFAELTHPGEPGDWSNALRTQAGLARKHNLSAFVTAVYVTAKVAPNGAFDSILPGAEAGLRALP